MTAPPTASSRRATAWPPALLAAGLTAAGGALVAADHLLGRLPPFAQAVLLAGSLAGLALAASWRALGSPRFAVLLGLGAVVLARATFAAEELWPSGRSSAALACLVVVPLAGWALGSGLPALHLALAGWAAVTAARGWTELVDWRTNEPTGGPALAAGLVLIVTAALTAVLAARIPAAAAAWPPWARTSAWAATVMAFGVAAWAGADSPVRPAAILLAVAALAGGVADAARGSSWPLRLGAPWVARVAPRARRVVAVAAAGLAVAGGAWLAGQVGPPAARLVGCLVPAALLLGLVRDPAVRFTAALIAALVVPSLIFSDPRVAVHAPWYFALTIVAGRVLVGRHGFASRTALVGLALVAGAIGWALLTVLSDAFVMRHVLHPVTWAPALAVALAWGPSWPTLRAGGPAARRARVGSGLAAVGLLLSGVAVGGVVPPIAVGLGLARLGAERAVPAARTAGAIGILLAILGLLAASEVAGPAALLLAAGGGLVAAAEWVQRRPLPVPAPLLSPRRRWVVHVASAMAVLAVVALHADGAWWRRHGESVLLPLLPPGPAGEARPPPVVAVPPPVVARALAEGRRRGRVIARVTPRGIGHVELLDDGRVVLPGQRSLKYRFHAGRLVPGPPLEALPERFQVAAGEPRHAEVRLTPGGRVVLVALREDGFRLPLPEDRQ